jgi:tetratricopeptide (TPR) repeat protein
VGEKPYAVARLDEIPRVNSSASSFDITPIRVHFGIGSFGMNAYSAPEAGGHVIEEHDELGSGAGRHEELYYVVSGRATFALNGGEIEAPTGTLVFVADPAVRRGAVAEEPGTTVLVAGGIPGQAFQSSPWEAWLAAIRFQDAGEPERGVEVFVEALERYPGNPNVLYNLACFESLAGHLDEALVHLSEAIELQPEMKEWAQKDSDFDAIRSDPRFSR